MGLWPSLVLAQDVETALTGQAQVTVQQQVGAALSANDFDGARRILVEQGATTLDRVYLEILILQRQNNHAEAVRLSREVLRARPELTVIRQRLLESLVALRDINGAIFQVDVLIDQAQTAEQRAQLAQARSAILARRPYGFGASFALVPSTNVNRATENTEAPEINGLSGTIEETSESGVGATLVLDAFRRFVRPGEPTAQINLSLALTGYTNPEFNRRTTTLGLSLFDQSARGGWRLSGAISDTLYSAEEDNNRRFILSGLKQWRVSPRNRITSVTTGTITDYRAAQNAIFDANALEQTFGLRRRIGDRSYWETGVTLSRSLAEDARFSYRGTRLSLGFGRNWANGWQVSASGTYEERPYDEEFSPLLPLKREDTIYGLSFSLLNSTITFRGATPRLSCGATWTSSNIVFYDSRDVVECSFALTTQF